MIDIFAEDSFIVIKPLDERKLGDAVLIYNCGSDTRYATGVEGSLSIRELSSLLKRIKACDNEFIAGVFSKAPDTGAENALRFVGICSGLMNAGALWIKQLSILPEYRRRGIGARTAEMLFEYAVRSHNVHEVFLSVAEKNAAGLCFWRKLGFCEAHRVEKVLFDEKLPINVIILQKKLT